MLEDTYHKQVSRDDLDILLAHLLRSPEVFLKTAGILSHEDFDPSAERAHRLIWYLCRKFYEMHRTMITLPILHTEISREAANMPEFFDPSMIESVHMLAHNLYGLAATDLVPSYAFDILESFLWQRRVHLQAFDAFEKGSFDRRMWEHLAKTVLPATCVIRGSVVEPFANDKDAFLGTAPRQATGVNFLDVMLGGGMRTSEVIGFIAPSGGGKTTLSNQLAIEGAKRQRHIFVFSYEESPSTPEYLAPVFACAAQIKRTRLDTIQEVKNFSEEELKKYQAAKKAVGSYLHFVDMSGTDGAGFGGVSEIDSVLARYAAQLSITGIIVDWLWPMMKRKMPQVKVAQGQRLEDRIYGQQVVDELKQVARDRKLWVWVNHQLSPAESTKKRDMEWNDAAEFKSFSWYLNGCFALSALDDRDYIGKMKFSKARGVQKSYQMVQLIGDYATFKGLGDDYSWDSRERRHVRVADKNTVPNDAIKSAAAPSGIEKDLSGKETELAKF